MSETLRNIHNTRTTDRLKPASIVVHPGNPNRTETMNLVRGAFSMDELAQLPGLPEAELGAIRESNARVQALMTKGGILTSNGHVRIGLPRFFFHDPNMAGTFRTYTTTEFNNLDEENDLGIDIQGLGAAPNSHIHVIDVEFYQRLRINPGILGTGVIERLGTFEGQEMYIRNGINHMLDAIKNLVRKQYQDAMIPKEDSFLSPAYVARMTLFEAAKRNQERKKRVQEPA